MPPFLVSLVRYQLHPPGVVAGPIPPTHALYSVPTSELAFYEQDIEGATALLAEAGYPGGFDPGILYIPTYHRMEPAAFPQEGEAHHATYSGSEIAFVLSDDLGVGLENATSRVVPGDFGYTRFEGGKMLGFPDTFSELCWFYDRDAVPSMPDGPVPVNIFGRIVEGVDAFAACCRDMRRTGVKVIRAEFAPEGE